jgi:hypothetical protein
MVSVAINIRRDVACKSQKASPGSEGAGAHRAERQGVVMGFVEQASDLSGRSPRRGRPGLDKQVRGGASALARA